VDEILETHVPSPRKQSYWFGYLYAAFWAFVTYSCFTHAVGAIRVVSAFLGTPHHAALNTQTQAELSMTTILWPLMTVVFAWVTYRLLARKVSMRMIYVLVGLHGLNALFEGLIPYKLVIFVVLSGIVVMNFREYFHANRPNQAMQRTAPRSDA
jgi:hypothetical protein